MKKIISTTDAPAAIGPYSQAIRSGDLIFCSGQIPLDPKSGQIVSDDITPQTRRVMDNISGVLKSEGLSLADTLPDANSPDPVRVAVAVETVAALGHAIDALPERERLVVSLYYSDGLTMKEISGVLEVSESRVSQLHTHAVAHLRTLMTGTGKKARRTA